MDTQLPIGRRAVVVVDGSAPLGGAFDHALEWAARFRVPVHALMGPDGGARESDLEAACTRRGVAWEVSRWEGPAGLDRVVRPTNLVLVGPSFPAAARKRLLCPRAPGTSPALLVCPAARQDWSRVLVINDRTPAADGFLALAVQVGRRFGARPVVLTVARSERTAQVREQAARAALAGAGPGCDFDRVVGAEVRDAVARVARWRRCHAVILEHPAARPWWRWWRSGTLEVLLDVVEPFALLALPEAGALAPAPVGSPPPPAPREVLPLPCTPC